MNENIFKNANGTLNIDLVCERWVYDKFYLVSNSLAGELVINGDVALSDANCISPFSTPQTRIFIRHDEMQEIAKRLNLVLVKNDSSEYQTGCYYSAEGIKKRLKKCESKKTSLEDETDEKTTEIRALEKLILKLKNSLKNE